MEEKTVYVDVGDKLNYAAYWRDKDGNLEFQAWIRKYCVKDTDEMIVISSETKSHSAIYHR